MMNIEIIWDEYGASLRRFLSSKVSNTADVDDLLQNILLKTHQSLGDLKEEEKIHSWLFQIANRTVIDFYRAQGRHRALSKEDLWYEDTDSIEDEMAQCIQPFIQCLPEKYASVLDAIEIQGKRQKNYAEEIGVPYSTLKSRVKKSRQELKALFKQCCEIELDKNGRVADFKARDNGCREC